jgi:hypothetical protein
MDRAARPPYWLTTRQENSRMDLLTVGLASGEEVLPVFSFEEEARAFLRLGTWGTGWQARETTAQELVSILLGPSVGVDRVVLDPAPEIEAEVMVALAGMRREDFVDCITGEEGELIGPAAKRHTLVHASRSGLCRYADVNKGVVAEAQVNPHRQRAAQI